MWPHITWQSHQCRYKLGITKWPITKLWAASPIQWTSVWYWRFLDNISATSRLNIQHFKVLFTNIYKVLHPCLLLWLRTLFFKFPKFCSKKWYHFGMPNLVVTLYDVYGNRGYTSYVLTSLYSDSIYACMQRWLSVTDLNPNLPPYP